MMFPKHMIMDFESKTQNVLPKHWSLKTVTNNASLPTFLHDLNTFNLYSPAKIQPNGLLFKTLNPKNSTVIYNSSRLLIGSKTVLNTLDSTYSPSSINSPRLPIKTLISPKQKTQRIVTTLLLTASSNPRTASKTNTWYSTLNINFLRKERLYTKLKYSRSPAYDIVSGGAAAIFAGFIGFLISEKFGFELADSGDFYYLFMYIVFIAFFFRPIITSLDVDNGLYGVFKLREIKLFYSNILSLIIIKVKRLFNKN